MSPKSYPLFFDDDFGAKLNTENNKIILPIYEDKKITNNFELFSPKMVHQLLTDRLLSQKNDLAGILWNDELINADVKPQFKRNLIFDAKDFEIHDNLKSEASLNFSFKMFFGLALVSEGAKKEILRDLQADEYNEVDVSVQKYYHPGIIYSGVLDLFTPRQFFGGFSFAVNYLTYLILNHQSPLDLNKSFGPIFIPVQSTLPIISHTFAYNFDQHPSALIQPFSVYNEQSSQIFQEIFKDKKFPITE